MSQEVAKHSFISEHGEWVNLLKFDHVAAFHEFVDHQMSVLSQANHDLFKSVNQDTVQRIESGSSWYGTPPPMSIKELEAHSTFREMDTLDALRKKVKQSLASFLALAGEELLPKPTLAYNDYGLGVFSFDRAAMGLQKTKFRPMTQPIDKTITKLQIELGKDQVTTSIRDVFTYFKNRDSLRPILKLYVVAGANANVSGDALKYVGLACAELVQFAEQRGVACAVSVLYTTSFDDSLNIALIRVKRPQDSFDLNQFLLLTSDTFYFRYRGFKAIIAIGDYFDIDVPEGLGSIRADVGKTFIQGYDPDGFVFEQSYSMDKSVKEVKRILESYQLRTNEKG